MSPSEIIRRFHTELWGAGDVSAIDRFVAPGARTLMTGFEGDTVEVLRQDVERYFRAFSEVRTSIDHLIAQGDQVAAWWHTTGVHTGPYGDIAPRPTGASITMEGVDLFTVVDQRIVEVRSFWDAAAVYRQFGLLADDL